MVWKSGAPLDPLAAILHGWFFFFVYLWNPQFVKGSFRYMVDLKLGMEGGGVVSMEEEMKCVMREEGQGSLGLSECKGSDLRIALTHFFSQRRWE